MSRLPKVLIKKILLTSIGYKRFSDIVMAIPSISSIQTIRTYSRWFYNDSELKFILLQASFYNLFSYTLKNPSFQIYKRTPIYKDIGYVVKASPFTNDTIMFEWKGLYFYYARLILENNKLLLLWNMHNNLPTITYEVVSIEYVYEGCVGFLIK